MSSQHVVVTVHRAQPIGDQVIPEMHIAAVPVWTDLSQQPLAEVMRRHEAEAQRIVDALVGSLPGGTLDAILRALLKHKASLLCVLDQIESYGLAEDLAREVELALVIDDDDPTHNRMRELAAKVLGRELR